jgi:hypothetical protein
VHHEECSCCKKKQSSIVVHQQISINVDNGGPLDDQLLSFFSGSNITGNCKMSINLTNRKNLYIEESIQKMVLSQDTFDVAKADRADMVVNLETDDETDDETSCKKGTLSNRYLLEVRELREIKHCGF